MNNKSILTQTKDINSFLPLMRELDFGDRFLLSMLHWCGFGKRQHPLEFWEVFLAKNGEEPLGIIGLYREIKIQSDVFWIGWFGVRPKYRKQGFGLRMIEELKMIARKFAGRELWTYTEQENIAAINLYLKAGFEKAGNVSEAAPEERAEPTDIVLKYKL